MTITCPSCHTPLKARAAAAGTTLACPRCGAAVGVPAERDWHDAPPVRAGRADAAADRPRPWTPTADVAPRVSSGPSGAGIFLAVVWSVFLLGLSILAVLFVFTVLAAKSA